MIAAGAIPAADIRVGDMQALAVYAGEELVWSRPPFRVTAKGSIFYTLEGTGITIDFGRYDDRAFGEMQSLIGTVGSGSSFSASAVHAAASRRTTSRVVCANGAIRLCIQPLGSVFVVK